MSKEKEGQGGIKIVVVGDGAVGKTSMLVSAATGKFPKEYIPTVFDNHEMDRKVDGETVHVLLYDTAGQEEYESLRLLSYPNTDVFLLVFSIGVQQSFDNIAKKWLKEVREHQPTTPCIVVGAKCDLRDDEGVIAEVASLGRPMLSKEEFEKRSLELGVAKYLECSAAAQINLSEVLDEAVRVAKAAEAERRVKEEALKQQKATNANGGGGCCMIC